MNAALLRKTLRDSLLLLAIVVLALIVFEFLFLRAISEFGDDILKLWMTRPVLSRFARLLLGAEVGGDMSKTMLVVIGLAHPFLYACTWTFILTVGTRVIVAEIDRGTVDLLLTLPLSRTSIYLTVSLATALCGMAVCLAPLLGLHLGQQVFRYAEPPDMRRLALLSANFYVLYVAIAGLTLLASTLTTRRGPAVAMVLAALLGSVVLNFLASFWKPAENLAFLSLLNYYRPLPVVLSGEFAWRDATILASVGLGAWLIGWWRFARRDIPAS